MTNLEIIKKLVSDTEDQFSIKDFNENKEEFLNILCNGNYMPDRDINFGFVVVIKDHNAILLMVSISDDIVTTGTIINYNHTEDTKDISLQDLASVVLNSCNINPPKIITIDNRKGDYFCYTSELVSKPTE